MSNIKQMLKQLETGVKQMEIAKQAQEHLFGELVSELPADKKAEALGLFSDAKKGKVDMSRFTKFAGDLSKEDKETMEKAVQKVDNKAEEVKSN